MASSSGKDVLVGGQEEEDDGNSDEEFEDAQFELPRSEVMNLEIALKEAKLAIDYFFNNELEEAKNLLSPWADQSMYHAMGISVFSYLEAILTFEQEHIKLASANLKKCLSICNRNRYSNTGSSSDSKSSFLPKLNMIPSAFQSNTDYINKMSDQQVHAELCYAETLLLKSVLTFIEDETLKNLLVGGMKIRSCYNCYKFCDEILRKRTNWESPASKLHFESGVKMGIGSFNLMISLLPQRVIKLLEFIGFSGNKDSGLNDLITGYNMDGGLRKILCTMTLLGYNLIVCYVLCYQDGDLEFCNQILDKQLEVYPNGLWFLFFKGRLEFMRGILDEAIQWYNKSFNSEQQIWSQFNHLCYWELLWVNCLSQRFCDAYVYARKLFNENKWSRTIYLYQKCIILMEFRKHPLNGDDPMGRIESADLRREIESELVTLDKNFDYCKFYKQRLSGKSLPMEKFIIKKVKRYFKQDNFLLLPIFELVYVWNLFKCFQTNSRFSSMTSMKEKNSLLLQNFLKYFERHEAFLKKEFQEQKSTDLNYFFYDNMMLLMLLKGVCFKYLNLPLQALKQFQSAMECKNELKEDLYLVPFCTVEIALIEGHELKNYETAINILESAKKNFTGYSLESRLHFRIHSALSEFRRIKDTKSGSNSPGSSR